MFQLQESSSASASASSSRLPTNSQQFLFLNLPLSRCYFRLSLGYWISISTASYSLSFKVKMHPQTGTLTDTTSINIPPRRQLQLRHKHSVLQLDSVLYDLWPALTQSHPNSDPSSGAIHFHVPLTCQQDPASATKLPASPSIAALDHGPFDDHIPVSTFSSFLPVDLPAHLAGGAFSAFSNWSWSSQKCSETCAGGKRDRPSHHSHAHLGHLRLHSVLDSGPPDFVCSYKHLFCLGHPEPTQRSSLVVYAVFITPISVPSTTSLFSSFPVQLTSHSFPSARLRPQVSLSPPLAAPFARTRALFDVLFRSLPTPTTTAPTAANW